VIDVALIALAAALALVSLGGGLYEFTVVDPAWPRRPEIIQPGRGGVSRRRFWIPAHVAFELALIAALVLAWARRSRWRMPLDLLTCGAMLGALVAAARLPA
jgi:hypothetical protein